MTEDLNSVLHQLKDSYMRISRNREDLAWQGAYEELASDGTFTDFYKYGFRSGRYSYMYLFAYAPSDKKFYTYLSAKVDDSPKIYLSEYTAFKNKIINKLLKSEINGDQVSNMIAGLNDVYGRIARDYILTFISKATSCADDRVQEFPVAIRGVMYNRIRGELISRIEEIFDAFGINEVRYEIINNDSDINHHFKCFGYTVDCTLSKEDSSATIR